MKFLVDAQLPRQLARLLGTHGHDAIHTLDLPLGNRTPDAAISEVAHGEGRIVMTKDADFITTFMLQGMPPQLLLVSTGNISNRELEVLVLRELTVLEAAFMMNRFVEINEQRVIVHA